MHSPPLQVRHLIGGTQVDAVDGATFEGRDPHDDSLLAIVARGSAEDGRRAVAAARAAFDDSWSGTTAGERAVLLHRLADLVDEHAEELAQLETRDGGKTIRDTRHADIPRVAHNFRFFADYAALDGNEAYPNGQLLSYTLYPPAGVVAAISPWNAPLMLASWKVAPALAFGNTVVLKPAPQTPLTAARLGELALAAGFPPGVLNVVHGYAEVAAALTAEQQVDRITFTGSTRTGRAVLAAAAANLTPVSAELGGKSANVVFADADLEVAVPAALRAIFGGAGQVCLAGSRLFVQREILPEFLERFLLGAKQLRIGDPKDAGTQLGPLIEQSSLERVHGYVRLAEQEGGNVVLGGERLRDPELARGWYYPPTVITGLTNDSRVAQEEIFGPVELLLPFDDEAEVLRQVNSSEYGLAGMLFTRDLDRAHRMAARWQAGTVWINCFFERDLRLPFGGERNSGLGREGGRHSREFFTEPRAVTLRLR
jgi:aminomuconate-semialdehyde/2-hydroxymuconate-6-semialdehyde dehydrogenase